MHAQRGRILERQRMTRKILLYMAVVGGLAWYIYFYNINGTHDDLPPIEERCISELSKVRYQLESISEYKKKMDSLMTGLQKDVITHKKRVDVLRHNYLIMKQHLETCEFQAEELEVECTNLKMELFKTNQELGMCKKPIV